MNGGTVPNNALTNNPSLHPARPDFGACAFFASTTTRSGIAALYTRPRSIYHVLGLECWGIQRDATRYAGPGPVIAHPPCGHWGRYSHLCTLPGRECGPIAIAQVRRWGGIVEHPASSQLWKHCGCPRRAGTHDLWGGQILRVNQGDYGHLAEKDTILYIVGIDGRPRIPTPAPGRYAASRPLEALSRPQRQCTPLAFAVALLALCSQVTTGGGAQ